MTTKKTRREFTDEFQREAVVLLQDSCSGLHSSAAGRALMGLIWLMLGRIIGVVWLTLHDPRRTLSATGLRSPAPAHARWD